MKINDSHEKLDEDRDLCMKILDIGRELSSLNHTVEIDIRFSEIPGEFYLRPCIHFLCKPNKISRKPNWR